MEEFGTAYKTEIWAKPFKMKPCPKADQFQNLQGHSVRKLASFCSVTLTCGRFEQRGSYLSKDGHDLLIKLD